LNFDGTYIVDDQSTTNSLFFTLATADVVPSWATLAGLIPAITAPIEIATLTRVPT
jgi:hypothetical protein